MQVAGVVVVLALLTAGSVHFEPDAPGSWRLHGAMPSGASLPGTTPTASAQQRPAPAVTPAPKPTPPLDLAVLEQELRETKAIGLFTKITLKNQIDDLLDEFRDYYRGKGKATIKDLRRRFDLLMMKVLSLLQDKDEKLASAIVVSREAIWELLADPKKFATLQG